MKKPIQRRDLLRFGSATFLLGGASSAFGLPRAAAAAPGPAVNPASKFLFVFQRGANCGLNTLVPHLDYAEYIALRPQIGLQPSEFTDLNGSAGLNNAMSRMPGVYSAGKLSLIHQVGYENHSRSHFESMRNIETTVHATPGFFEGFVPRVRQVLDPTGLNPLFAVSVSNALQTAFKSTTNPSLHMQNIASYKLDPNASPSIDYTKLLGTPSSGIKGAFNEPAVPGHQHDPFVRQTGQALLDSLDTIANLGPFVSDTSWTSAGYSYPASYAQAQAEGLQGTGAQLSFLTKLRDAMHLLTDPSTGTQVAGVEIGGWDTHADQRVEQDGLLAALDHGLFAAYKDAIFHGVIDDLVIFVITEFGRTSGENASLGTDHGNGLVSLVLGGPVLGGTVHNCDPSTWTTGPTGSLHAVTVSGGGPSFITHRTDYRAMFMEVFEKHFGITAMADQDLIIPGYSTISAGDPKFNYLGLL